MTEKKTILDSLHFPRRIKEAVPAGTQYVPAMTALQFYSEVEKEIKKRIKKAKESIEKYRNGDHVAYLDADRIVIPLTKEIEDTTHELTIDEIIKEALDLAQYLKMTKILKQSEEALAYVQKLKIYEENNANKQGIDELRKFLMTHDILTAAALKED